MGVRKGGSNKEREKEMLEAFGLICFLVAMLLIDRWKGDNNND